jgi:hypothetical protein
MGFDAAVEKKLKQQFYAGPRCDQCFNQFFWSFLPLQQVTLENIRAA